ncbi:hypothetical protein BKA93DRAFT_727147 [Sparassis latifolia]
MSISVAPLPLYPSTRARGSLSPSQLAILNQAISSSLAQTLALPPAKRDTPATLAFVSSYAKDIAQQLLQSLIWEDEEGRSKLLSKLSQAERSTRQRVFLLAERFAAAGLLDLQALLDLSVAYSSTNPTRLRSLFKSALSGNASILTSQVEAEAIPAFTALLGSPSQGLYGLRKAAHILLSFLRPAPLELSRPIARDKAFMLALGKAYDHGLSAVSQSYGGIRIPPEGSSTLLDQWERLFLETKVALIDSFHILLGTLLSDIASVPTAGSALAAQCEPAFEVVFALLELPLSQASGTPTPFLNQPLLADYQHAYDLSRTLMQALRSADDARTELLESALRALDVSSGPGGQGDAGPGVLKLLIRSSGVPPGIDNLGRGPSKAISTKGKEKALGAAPVVEDEVLDAAMSQVLDILPDQAPAYVRFLLSHPDYPYRGNAERLIEALLEGTAPGVGEVEAAMADDSAVPQPPPEEFVYTKDRRNVFDEERMDVSHVRIGKKTEDASTVLQDRAFIEQMKADILRRAEMIDSDEEDGYLSDRVAGAQEKGQGRDLAFEDDLDDDGVVRVRDGDSDEEGDSDGPDTGEEATQIQPETILELAYLRDPKLFDRDGQTRRSKSRADLKAQTGWSDEQIEGWKIMLERDPKKDKILAKHEFSGNRPGTPVSGPSRPSSRGGGDRGGRGRGDGGRGRGGRGRGGTQDHGPGGGGGEGSSGRGGDRGSTRDRTWKDKNKASRGNHNRKRGHDKKMARGGGPS